MRRLLVTTCTLILAGVAACTAKPGAEPAKPAPAAAAKTPEAAQAPEAAPPAAQAPEAAPPAAQAPEAAPPAAQAPEAAPLNLDGTLVYTPLPPTKSVEAYMGVEFTLTDGAGTAHVLGATDGVTSEALQGASGKRVRVQCVMEEAAAPSPHESYPTGPDGEPMKRPAKCRVNTLTVL